MPSLPTSVPRAIRSVPRSRAGYIHVYTGEGKGKTTAAIGLAVRSLGHGRRVFIGQFLKAGGGGELAVLERHDGVTVEQYGGGGFCRAGVDADQAQGARAGMTSALAALSSGLYDLVVLDEIDVALSFGLLTLGDCRRLLDVRPDHVDLVFTGRSAPPELTERADLVTEMREVKHYFRRGVTARPGIEY